MDFVRSAEEEAFAAEVRQFLREHPPAGFPIDGMDAGYGSGANSRAFLRALAARGWLSMTWPRAFGGVERHFRALAVVAVLHAGDARVRERQADRNHGAEHHEDDEHRNEAAFAM